MSNHYKNKLRQREKVAHLENGPHPLAPSPNNGRGGTMTGWLPPLPLLGEGGWGGEGQTCCATFSIWPNYW